MNPASGLTAPHAAPWHLTAIAQVGGHAGILGDGAWVYKPLQRHGARGDAEAEFYAAAARGGAASPPASLLPRYGGVVRRGVGVGEGVGDGLSGGAGDSCAAFLALEDVTRRCARPCVMDVKMGVRAWGEDASAAKAAAERAKCPSQAAVGLRVTGMRVWQPATGRYRASRRGWGYSLDEASLPDAFRAFLADGAGGTRRDVLPALLARLAAIRAWFAQQHHLRFYGSSLLLVYDGAPRAGEEPHHTADVRMIDFAHVWPIPTEEQPHGRDDGYLTGLDSLVRYLRAAGEGEGGEESPPPDVGFD